MIESKRKNFYPPMIMLMIGGFILMHYHEPSGTVWFGTDTNYIGRAIVEPAR